jgi:hypothetical protein
LIGSGQQMAISSIFLLFCVFWGPSGFNVFIPFLWRL